MKFTEIKDLLEKIYHLSISKIDSKVDFTLIKFKKIKTRHFYYCLHISNYDEIKFNDLISLFNMYLPKNVKLIISISGSSKRYYINSKQEDYNLLLFSNEVKPRPPFYLIEDSIREKSIF